MSRLPQTGDKWHLPFPLGKFPVIGYHDIMTGKSKVDGLLVRLLYPAEDQNINTVERQAEWANWYPHENYKIGLTSMLSPRLRNVVRVLQYFGGDLHVPIIANAKPFSQRLFPVIIFSHGMSSNRTTYSNLCTQLASHGFIIAGQSVDNPNDYISLAPFLIFWLYFSHWAPWPICICYALPFRRWKWIRMAAVSEIIFIWWQNG